MKLCIALVLVTLAAFGFGTPSLAESTRAAHTSDVCFETGGWHLTMDDDYDLIVEDSAKDANVDITNDGPGSIEIRVFNEEYEEIGTYTLEAGKSKAVGVPKGGHVGIKLMSDSEAKGSYTI